MGHTAGIHTRSREAAVKFGVEMPASRVTVNTPTTHGAIGFSTALPPSMTLGCGSWGGNVTSDNVSPLHLMDIKRVAFETRPVKSARPAGASVTPSASPLPELARATPPSPAVVSTPSGKINREEIAAIVDKFLAGRQAEPNVRPATPIAAEAGSMYVPKQSEANPEPRSGNGSPLPSRPAEPAVTTSSSNGRKAVDFVSEDDVRRAIQKGEKIYVGPRTIITPAARDLGDPAEVFAKA
jgi:acetaldehyde dehydrogenase (acetylating)